MSLISQVPPPTDMVLDAAQILQDPSMMSTPHRSIRIGVNLNPDSSEDFRGTWLQLLGSTPLC